MRHILSILYIMCSLCSAMAQGRADSTATAKQRSLELYLEVKDHLTHDCIDSTLCVRLVLAADSSFVDSCKVERWEWEGKFSSYVSCTVHQPGDYYLQMSADGYTTLYYPIHLPRFYRSERYRQLKPAYLHRLPKQNDYLLDEVVVKASKLKFYMDGDTLVYDADAFSLAEGSMLDQLIRKLPGVQLKSGGEITVNGERVESLLLNGKDFFDSDRELLLDNMPAYMVKSVQTYKRTPIEVRGTNQEKITPKELVMNVKLKRDYNSGWLGNASGGIGHGPLFSSADGEEQRSGNFSRTRTPYLGRLFAMRFSDIGRIALYAQTNNINDSQTPGERGDWSPFSQSEGLTTTVKAGVNGSFGDWDKMRYEGSANVEYKDDDNAQHSSGETFLQGGNTFSRSFQQSRSYDLSFDSYHNYYRTWNETLPWAKYFTISLNSSVNYSRWNRHSTSASATLREDVASQLGKAWMDSIASPLSCDLLRRYAISRTITAGRQNGHSINTGMNGYINYSLPHNDLIDIKMRYSYNFSEQSEKGFEHYRSPLTTEGMFLNRHTPTIDRTHSVNVNPSASISLDQKQRHNLTLRYDYDYSHQYTDNPIYLLHQLSEWGDSTQHPIGTLPSVLDMERTLDQHNSSHKRFTTHKHSPMLTYRYSLTSDTTMTMLSATLNMHVNRERMDYWMAGQVDTLFSRTTRFLSPTLHFYHSNYRTQRFIQVYMNIDHQAPQMTSLLNITDTSDPLRITRSNPHLRNSTIYSINASWQDKFRRTLFNVGAGYNITQNAIASGFVFDRETGIRTITPDNVNGNYNINANAGIDLSFDQDEKWRLSNNASYNFVHSVDLSGTSDQMEATRSVVGTHNLNNALTFTFRPSDKMEFSAKGNVHWQHSTSERQDFTTINAATLDYGVTAQLELPWSMQLSTDLTMYSRRGYSDPSMNTNELVWNARLSKRFLKGNLTLMLDTFDILGNLSNVQHSINAQGRTETYLNVIPSYGILHAVYRLNFNKKK